MKQLLHNISYYGFSKNEYTRCARAINAKNMHSYRLITGLMTILFACTVLAGLYNPTLARGDSPNLLAVGSCSFLYALSYTDMFKKHTTTFMYLCVVVVLSIGIILSITYKESISVAYPLYLIITAFLFIGNYLAMATIFIAMSFLLAATSVAYKSGDIAPFDITHLCSFMIVALGLHLSMGRTSIKALLNDIQQKEMLTNIRIMHETYVAKTERDELTGLYVRNLFIEQAQPFLDDSISKHRGCAFLIMDLDNFKHINDTYGHLAGDSLLREVGMAFKQLVPLTALVGRLGGDEFVCINPMIHDEATGRQFTDSIHAAVHEAGQNLGFIVYASVGMVFAPRYGTTFNDLYSKADAALYAAKRTGRRHTVVYDENTPEVHRKL